MRLKGVISVIATCLSVILCVTLASGQTKKGSQRQKVPRHDAAAILKLVTVRVLDHEGHPVTSLRKQDFVLYDNGKKKVITEFEVHELSEEGMKVRASGEATSLTEQ